MIDNDYLPELPRGWVYVEVSSIAKLIKGVSYGKSEASKEQKDGYLPILRANNIGKELSFNDLVYVPTQRITSEQYVKTFDILIAMSSGSKDIVGKASQASSDFQGGFGAFCGLIRVSELLDRRFVGFFFQSPIYRHHVSELSSGINIYNLRRNNIELLLLPLPPLTEQHRIVAKIEELFTRLDAGVEALKKIQLQLKRYRQAVLKAAFEGKLTAEWREAHKAELEPASVLLERIKAERKKKLGSKYKEPPPVDTSELPRLPDGWEWQRLDGIADIKGGVTVDKKRTIPNGRWVPYLRVANVQRGYLDLTEIKEILADKDTISQLSLKEGDILFNEGGDRDKLGRGWIWQNQIPECIHQNHVFRARLYSNDIQGKLVSWFGNTFGQQYFSQEGKQTTNLASVNLTKLSAFPVPIPSREEQIEMVNKIEYHFSIADDIDKVIEQSLKQAERLRQSILKRAFEGKLVPQDPHDEPAEKLLERIKAEKAKLETTHKIPRRKAKTVKSRGA